MAALSGRLSGTVRPDWEGLVRCIKRQGTPPRVFHLELFLDAEVQTELCARFGIGTDIPPSDPFCAEKRHMALMAFLGYDTVRCKPEGVEFSVHRESAEDSAGLARRGGRSFVDEHRGPITSWEEFEAYPWPDAKAVSHRSLEFYEKNLPEGMCVATGGIAHFCEYVVWLMGYETLCYTLFENRPLVLAIRDKLVAFYREVLAGLLSFDRVRIIWSSDDMGFRTGTLLSPADLRELVLPGHALMAKMAHAAGRTHLLHSCGNLAQIMDDLIDGVGIDAKHSFEDTIERVEDAKARYGSRIGVLGGVDVDFLCRATPEQVRERTRRTLTACQPGGGWCLGSGNSIANYMPVENYLAMLDEGRRFTP
jgi:uroporphyrinogen decarboxylase